jgi:hypothetical protein
VALEIGCARAVDGTLEFAQQPSLSDARLADQADDPPLPAFRLGERILQRRELAVATDEGTERPSLAYPGVGVAAVA